MEDWLREELLRLVARLRWLEKRVDTSLATNLNSLVINIENEIGGGNHATPVNEKLPETF